MGRPRRRPRPTVPIAAPPSVAPEEPTTVPDVDLDARIAAAVKKATAPKPLEGRKCDFCGLWVEAKGGKFYGPDWACSYCTRWTGSEGMASQIMDYAASALVGMPRGICRVGSGTLIERSPADRPAAGRRWSHVDVADLRQRWKARYGSVPFDLVERMRAIVASRRRAAEGNERRRRARIRHVEKEIARQQQVLERLR